jgi:hypothetical protein
MGFLGVFGWVFYCQPCLKVSSTRVRTRPEHYLLGIGIEKDYTAMVAVWSLLAVFAASCVGLSAFRLYKLRCCCRLDLMESGKEDADDDNRSTKQILSSGGSEPSSIAGLSSSATAAGVVGCDRSRLVENEVASPTEDPPPPSSLPQTTKALPSMMTKTTVKSSLSSRVGGGNRGQKRPCNGSLR